MIFQLSTPKSFLLLLKSRARNTPDAFAHADEEFTHLGRTSGALHPAFLNCYSMMMHGDDAPSYGKIYSWDDHPDAFEWMSSRLGVIPGEGLMILEIPRTAVDISCQLLREYPA